MVVLVDTYALGAYAARCAGSSPVPGTTGVALAAIFVATIDFFAKVCYNRGVVICNNNFLEVLRKNG